MRTTSPYEFGEWLKKAKAEQDRGFIPVWTGGWTEGPFTFEHLESKLVGAVIGLYKPQTVGTRPVDKSNNGENDG